MRAGQRGGATLATALVVLLAGSLLAAALSDVARTELLVARDRRVAAVGFAAADACVARVVAALPAGWAQADALAGPDGTSGTADDGVRVAPSGCVATLLPGPLGAARPFLDVAVTVPGGGRRVRAIVGVAAAPSPAVVWAVDAALGVVGGRVDVDGVDPARPDVDALPAFATADDPALTDAWIAASGGVTVAPGTVAAEIAPAPPLGAALWSRLAAAGAVPVFVSAAAPPLPMLHAIDGDVVVTAPGYGSGLLVVRDRLDIEADFAFSGVVAVSGGVYVASGATLRIAGSLWLGVPALDVAGRLEVRHDRAALDAADTLFRLPRRAALAGQVDR